MFEGPDIQCRRRNLIYQWNGKAETREVYSFDVMLAGITGFDAHMLVFGCMKITEFCWPLFLTISARNSSKRPTNRAGCTYKVSVASLRSRFSDLKKTDLWHTAAKWTAPFRGFKHSIKWVP